MLSWQVNYRGRGVLRFGLDGGVPLQPLKTTSLIITFGERYPFLGIFLETLTHFINFSLVMKTGHDDW